MVKYAVSELSLTAAIYDDVLSFDAIIKMRI